MSFILDALRKSEQERQIASGHGVGMLYPATHEQKPGVGRKAILLGIVALIVTIGLNWWSWSRVAPSAQPAAVVKAAPLPAAPVIPPVASPPPPERKSVVAAVPTPEKTTRKAPAEPTPAAANAAAPTNDSPVEAPRGMPTISISGYIKDETGGNLAIINDKLVREGDEVSPGLRLEKIDGENAFFNYKGQRFRR